MNSWPHPLLILPLIHKSIVLSASLKKSFQPQVYRVCEETGKKEMHIAVTGY